MTSTTTTPTTAGDAPFRTAAGGRIDRSATLEFTFAGRTLTGHPGDTLASALLAHGVHQVGTSVKLGRPRGIGAAWAEDPGSLVQIEEPFPEPMLLATTVELHDGLVADGVPGQGRLAQVPDSAHYDASHLHVDVLVVGAGPAGLLAALTAARSGARVGLLDEQSEAGGSLLGTPELLDGAPALDWVAGVVAELAATPDVTHLQRTTAFGVYDDGFVLAVERRTDHLGGTAPRHLSRQRVWRVRAEHVVVATGAHERPVVFVDNDRPGTMLAGSARTFLHRYGVLPGTRAVVFTTGDSAWESGFELAAAGVQVTLVDSRPEPPDHLLEAAAAHGITVHVGSVVEGTRGVERVSAALVRDTTDETGGVTELGCDLLLVSGGWNPAVHLFSQARGRLRFDATLGAFLPDGDVRGLSVAGAAAGTFDLAGCLDQGREVAAGVLAGLGFEAPAPVLLPAAERTAVPGPTQLLWHVPGEESRQFVDVQRDATVADVVRAVGAGLRSPEHVKRYTTIGTAHDQGKTSGIVTSGILAALVGTGPEDVGTTTFRPPYTPVAFATLAGRDRGHLFDPERTTPLHAWHEAAGAVFEDVGQWKRPRYYPRPGEDMEAAVLRECAAARTGVGILDGSTLGKIDVSGPDAGEFLDRVYTNVMSSLKVGRARYGVMCGVDGMVLDDGTVLRLAEDRFLLYTTTGGAAKVLDWMEEWLQTEWPGLRVHLTSVTEQFCTFPVVGPRSRDVIGAVFTGVDVSKEAFGFMQWVDTTVALDGDLDGVGVPVRLSRISFSGELAWEVNVSGWDAPAVWDRLLAAGAEFGITPYGTETMHVLRAEKGYPIIGQDTDGTVTPHDLGLGWAVSKKKVDFIGKRSFARAVNLRTDRKQLVGLLPVDRDTVLPEGSQLVEFCAGGGLPAPPVPMLGHVTSSYRSAFLDRPFALALLEGGTGRVGDVLHVPVGDSLVAVEVTGPVLVDPEGDRRDG